MSMRLRPAYALSVCGSFTNKLRIMRTNRTDAITSASLELIFRELVGIRRDVRHLRHELFRDKEQIMSALTELQDAMGALVTEAVTDLETVIEKLSQVQPDDTAALQALTQQAKDATAKLKADMAPLLTTPAPAPAPTPEPAPAPAPAEPTTDAPNPP